MKNIYEAALSNASCLQELLYDDFSGRALETATIVLDKGAVLYKVYGTKVALMGHSDQFKTTPNEISWYSVWSTSEDDSTIQTISLLENPEELIPEEAYEEIMFFVNAAQGNG